MDKSAPPFDIGTEERQRINSMDAKILFLLFILNDKACSLFLYKIQPPGD